MSDVKWFTTVLLWGQPNTSKASRVLTESFSWLLTLPCRFSRFSDVGVPRGQLHLALSDICSNNYCQCNCVLFFWWAFVKCLDASVSHRSIMFPGLTAAKTLVATKGFSCLKMRQRWFHPDHEHMCMCTMPSTDSSTHFSQATYFRSSNNIIFNMTENMTIIMLKHILFKKKIKVPCSTEA